MRTECLGMMGNDGRGNIILASGSPRRGELLKQLGLSFVAVAPDLEEGDMSRSSPEEAVRSLARLKAQQVARRFPEALVIGADTVVASGGRLLGKPETIENALSMLRAISGREHTVYTGVALIRERDGLLLEGVERTRVKIKALDEEEITGYVETGEPLDKAGAYAIQGKGAAIVEWIHGCYTNVVGLPLGLLVELLKRSGFDIWNVPTRSREPSLE